MKIIFKNKLVFDIDKTDISSIDKKTIHLSISTLNKYELFLNLFNSNEIEKFECEFIIFQNITIKKKRNENPLFFDFVLKAEKIISKNNVCSIDKISETYGWMSNMSDHPISYKNNIYPRNEHLFQCLRFSDLTIIEEIRNTKNPMSAKIIAKKNQDKMVISQCGNQDVENMRLCISLKLEQHPDVKEKLIETKDLFIYENVIKRSGGNNFFWGGYFNGDDFVGMNWLGIIWMENRKILRG